MVFVAEFQGGQISPAQMQRNASKLVDSDPKYTAKAAEVEKSLSLISHLISV